MTASQTKPRKDKIVWMGDSPASSILTRFSTYRFSFVLITRTFHKWQNIQKQNTKQFSNIFFRETPESLKHEIKNCHWAAVIENGSVI